MIQSEWIFLQDVTWDTGDAFSGVEKMIHGFFCLVLSLERKTPPTHCKISKYDAGQETPIRLLNSVKSAKDKYQSSQKSSAEIVQAVTGGGELSNANHLLELIFC